MQDWSSELLRRARCPLAFTPHAHKVVVGQFRGGSLWKLSMPSLCRPQSSRQSRMKISRLLLLPQPLPLNSRFRTPCTRSFLSMRWHHVPCPTSHFQDPLCVSGHKSKGFAGANAGWGLCVRRLWHIVHWHGIAFMWCHIQHLHGVLCVACHSMFALHSTLEQ